MAWLFKCQTAELSMYQLLKYMPVDYSFKNKFCVLLYDNIKLFSKQKQCLPYINHIFLTKFIKPKCHTNIAALFIFLVWHMCVLYSNVAYSYVNYQLIFLFIGSTYWVLTILNKNTTPSRLYCHKSKHTHTNSYVLFFFHFFYLCS